MSEETIPPVYPDIEHWHYMHGKPGSLGRLKAEPEHFIVTETLPFSPCGSGEHLYLQIRKKGVNTGFLAQQLAEHYDVKERDVSFAGRKDKQALTTQWFSVWLPGQSNSASANFRYPDCEILQSQWHNKKLRPGNIEQNQFDITITECELSDDIESRIDTVRDNGVPNYFGAQRFGNINQQGIAGNLAMAQYLLNGETIRKREKRSMAISALRSWLFNQFVSERLRTWQAAPLSGDVMSLAGSNSFFVAEELNEEIISRLSVRDIQLSAPLWGKGELDSLAKSQHWENSIAEQHKQLCSTLERMELKQERRKMLLYPGDLTYELKDDQLRLKFSLPTGCFATSVIRELLRLKA